MEYLNMCLACEKRASFYKGNKSKPLIHEDGIFLALKLNLFNSSVNMRQVWTINGQVSIISITRNLLGHQKGVNNRLGL